MEIMMARVALVLFVGLLANFSHAHHGRTSQFDQTKDIHVEGVVTKIRLVNPHSYVYFDVTNDDGSVDGWRCEMRAGGLLKSLGWTEEMFAAGTRINIDGAPARREPHGCYVASLSLDNGPTIGRQDSLIEEETGVDRPETLPGGTPNIAGNWVRDGRPDRPEYASTQAGTNAVADYDREDNPRFHCLITNILFDWTFDGHVNAIEQSDEKIRLTYGFMDAARVIHLDTSDHPDDLPPSRLGHSIGKWDGDTLVVDTVGFEPGFLFARPPTAHSNQLHVVERFGLSDDGKTLIRDYRGEDPEYLEEPFEGQDRVVFTTTAYQPYECEDLTDEVVEGF